jgi:hypothetical protein
MRGNHGDRGEANMHQRRGKQQEAGRQHRDAVRKQRREENKVSRR